MKIRFLYVLLACCIIGLSLGNNAGYANVSGGGKTNAPGEGNCGDCHSGGDYGSSGTMQILNMSDVAITKYNVGETYKIRVTLNAMMPPPFGDDRYGFQVTVLDAANNAIGTLAPSTSNTRVTNVASREYGEHLFKSTSNVFEVLWTAPSMPSGDVSIFGYGNIVNNQNNIDGDEPVPLPTLVISEIPLPVKLVNFSGRRTTDGNLISWETASEEKNDYFELEHSQDGLYFNTLTKINAQNNSYGKDYLFLDNQNRTGISYYRLKQVDLDEQFEYSSIISIDNGKTHSEISISPNPSVDVLEIRFNLDEPVQSIQIYNLNGQLLEEVSNIDKSTVTTINVREYPTGTYVLILRKKDSMKSYQWLKQ